MSRQLSEILHASAARGWLAGYRFEPRPDMDRDDVMNADVEQVTKDMQRRLTLVGLTVEWPVLAMAFAGGAGFAVTVVSILHQARVLW